MSGESSNDDEEGDEANAATATSELCEGSIVPSVRESSRVFGPVFFQCYTDATITTATT
jgi:hypothetical protein